jgi:protein TonB
MDSNNRYFILSGFISFGLFFLFLTLFAYMMFSGLKNRSFGMTKKSYISVSMIVPKESSSKTLKKSAAQKQIEQKHEKQPKEIDVNDLFSDVWTPKIKKVPKRKVNSKRLNDIAKKLKTLDKKNIKKSSDAKNVSESTATKDAQATSSGTEVNEYFAKIQAIVYEHFHVPPNSEGESVQAVIELDAFGKMIDFRIVRYSANDLLNEEVDRIKERLRNVIFPKNPKNRSSKIDVILRSKE